MGLMQMACETYCSNLHMADALTSASMPRAPLVPASHTVINAQIQVTVDSEGHFSGARTVDKEEQQTVIPVTEKSASRTSHPVAHPLCDQLKYVGLGCADYPDREKYQELYEQYIAQLTDWAKSAHTHPKVRAILAYCRGGTLVRDLASAGVVQCDGEGLLTSGHILGTEYPKCLVRWCVVPAPDGVSSKTWKDATLFESFAGFLGEKQGGKEQDYCYITGACAEPAKTHPSGIIRANFRAKLISANDGSNFTYRGRFETPAQALSVSCEATERAHSALRWVAANQGVPMGGRTFVCWNPKGKPIPAQLLPFAGRVRREEAETRAYTMPEYRDKLEKAMAGFREDLDDNDDVVVAAFDAATTGRLSVTYYNELKASDFRGRLARWHESCCWYDRRYGGVIRSPSPRDIVNFAFGTQQGEFVKADDRLMKEHAQSILHCIVDQKPVPLPFVRAAAGRVSGPPALRPESREAALFVACALIRKYRNDKAEQEVWKMELDKNCRDRSYLFGRLLAVAEDVESVALYRSGESRETNAMRAQSTFQRRPMYAWGILEGKLRPFFKRLPPQKTAFYKKLIQEICHKFDYDTVDETAKKELNGPLEPVYLLGYYLQRAALRPSREKRAGADGGGGAEEIPEAAENETDMETEE